MTNQRPEQTKFFKKLNLLFSTPNVIKQLGNKKLGFNINQKGGSTTGGGSHNMKSIYPSSMYTNSNNKLQHSNPFSAKNNDLSRRLWYYDYEIMDKDSIPSSVLDIYTDDATQENDDGELLEITSDNEEIKEIIETLFFDILNIDFSINSWIRNLLKYGDFFLYLNIEEKNGITNVIPLSPYNVERVEGEDENEPFKVQFKLTGGDYQDITLENYEVAHFRLLSDTAYLPYGKSIIESGRQVWKQLKMMEDAMLIYRVTRSPERRVFTIDVGGIKPDDVSDYMKKVINQIKKVPIVDEQTGELNLKYNVEAIGEDFFFASRNGNSTANVDTLAGGEGYKIDDIEYLRDKQFAAYKVPKSYLTYEEDLNGKNSLANEDVRFARSIKKIQKIIEAELTKVVMIHLYSLGYSGEDLMDFDIQLTHPSTIHEKQKLEILESKVGLLSTVISDKTMCIDRAYKDIMGWSEEEIEENKKGLKDDAIFNYTLEKITEDGTLERLEDGGDDGLDMGNYDSTDDHGDDRDDDNNDDDEDKITDDEEDVDPDLDVKDTKIAKPAGNKPEFNVG